MTMGSTFSRRRGTSLIEAMISITMLLIGLAGFASLQPVIVRSNHFAKRVAVASMLATDLEESVHRWGYADARLAPSMTLTGCNTASMSGCFADPTNVVPKWDMGKSDAGSYTPQFSDADLGTYRGVPVTGAGADVDRDGTPEFFRYWNVYEIDPSGSTIPNGKLVQIIVRWKEPNYGFRQVTNSAFKFNPAVVLQ